MQHYHATGRKILFDWAKSKITWPDKITRVNNRQTFEHKDTKIRVTLIADNTEQPVAHYAKDLAENATYSGKQGENTFSRLHAVAPNGYCYYAGYSYPGSINDQSISNLFTLEKRIDNDEGYMLDRGYSGVKGDKIIRKRNGRLNEDDKKYNPKIDKMRVVVENHFAYLKKWHILGDTLRMKVTKKANLDVVRQIHHEYWYICTALYNEYAPYLRDHSKSNK